MALATDYSAQLIKCKSVSQLCSSLYRWFLVKLVMLLLLGNNLNNAHCWAGCSVLTAELVAISGVVDSMRSCPAAGLFINGEWMTLDDVLSDKAKEDGCFQAKSSKERAVHFIMSQIFYLELESPDALEMEAVFDLPDFTDDITILWQNGTAVGFYSIKQKGVTDERTAEQYPMVTLDSIYVSPFHRRCGAATKLLEHLAATHCDQDIAVSTPISSTMRKGCTPAVEYSSTVLDPHKAGLKEDIKAIQSQATRFFYCAEEISCRETNIPAKILGSRRDRTRRRQKIDMVFSAEERKAVTEG